MWPRYPFPYEPFDLGYHAMGVAERDKAFEKANANSDKIVLVGDAASDRTVMFTSLNHVGGNGRIIGNMTYRIHPDCCDHGLGSRFIQLIADRCFASGIDIFRFDVAAPNARAIRCYEKAGFKIVEEFWRGDQEFLETIDIESPSFDFLRPHALHTSDGWKLRFYWMERRAHTPPLIQA